MKGLLSSCGRAARAVLVLLLLGGGCRSAEIDGVGVTGAQAEIRALLDEQAAAWNRGDLERFMNGYARTDSMRFASGGAVHRGWQVALERYRNVYPDRTAMGTLAFDRVDVRVLSPQWAMAFGRWRLQGAGDAPRGLFTLLLERRADSWRIVHDHTSSAR